jgi:hypothetical protein
MSNSPGYKALLIRADARELIDQAKDAHEQESGIKLNYSQFVTFLCKQYLKEVSKTEQ